MALRLYNRLEYQRGFPMSLQISSSTLNFSKKENTELHTHGLTLFLLKRPSEMMMLIWPWCVFFDPKKTPFVDSSLREAWAEGTCWTRATAPHTKQGRDSVLSKKLKGIYIYIYIRVYNYIVLDFLDVYTMNIHINVHHINTAVRILCRSTVCQYLNPQKKKKTRLHWHEWSHQSESLRSELIKELRAESHHISQAAIMTPWAREMSYEKKQQKNPSLLDWFDQLVYSGFRDMRQKSLRVYCG